MRGQPVDLRDYDPRWPPLYEQERTRLARALGARAARIEHVGSTAVPDLPSKPVVDVVIELTGSFEPLGGLVAALVRLGYAYVPDFEDELPDRRYFERSDGPALQGYHLHVYERGAEEVARLVALRDHLRADAEDARRYAALKRELAYRFDADRDRYTREKGPFVRALLAKIDAALT